MEKIKGLFSFREHPVGNFSDRKKGRKRKGGRLRQGLAMLLAVALVGGTLPANGLTVSASGREAGLCKHHQEHDADCGYISKSEDGEGSPCTYKCRICPVENLIAALPDKGTKRNEFRLDNAEDVRAQLEEILALYRELNEDEQEQIDLSRCYELQAALDGANAPDPVTESVEYQEASWNDGVTYTTETADSCTPVADSADAVTWDAGWYVVNSTVTITEPITVTGAVNLILADGCTLNAQKGIVVTKGNSLTIYAQSGGSGTLNATGTTDSSNNASAGIGGSETAPDSGAITIHGGVINATGGGQSGRDGGAGIGGGSPRSGNGGSSGAVIIFGGTVTANSGAGNLTGAGIGGGSNITIYGGNVTAEAHGTSLSGSGAGIGGGFGSNDGGVGSNIQIHGGTVHATGGYCGAGIGGGGGSIGYKSGDGTVTISGGIVTAVGGQYAAGIGGGGGYYYSSQYGSGGLTGGTGNVTISGGIVDASSPTEVAWAGYEGAPIGNGGNAGDTAATVNKTTGIVFENGAGTVYGAVTLDGSYTVPADYTLNIPAGASLSGSGTLSGGSAFTTENLTADMISVPTNLYYTGKDRSADITTRLSGELDKGVTICGQTFAVSGWTLAVAKTDDLTYTATYTNNNDSTNTFTKTITLLKSGTKFEGDVKTYNGDTQTTAFNADDTITVKATPAATGTAPAKAAARLRGSYTAPTAGQMALFVGDVQVSEPVQAGEGGTYTMTVSAAEVLLQGNAESNGDAITLTAKFVGNDNMADAAGTVDVKISAVAMAEKDGEVIGYFGVSNFEGSNNLFFQNAYTNATITLLEDVQPSTNSETGITCSTMVNITCALDLAGHNFASTDTAIYVLPGGNLTIQDSSTGKTGNVSFIKSDGTLTLYGGTFGKIETAYTLASLLAENCAYYKGSTPILLSELEGQKTLDGTVTVQECQHKDVTPTANNDGTHTLSCPYCGYTKAAENCDYGEYTHNDTSHTRICKLCGYQNVEAHKIKCTAEASGTVIAVSEACKTCGYGKDLGTVTIHIPKLVYGDLTGVVTAENTLTEPVAVAGNVKNPLGETIIFSDHVIIDPPTMATLTGNALLSAGEHKIKIDIVIIRDENALAECELTFNVDPAPLTADMVTLSAESTTYSGTEQKPTVTVAGLTEGTDYEVRYTRDGVVTNDFTSAGTVKITVTGKGNYGGEVEKTFTIKQEESDVGTVTAETLENTLDVSQVVLSRTNQTLAGTLMLTDSTLKYGTNSYTWKFTPDNTNYKTVTGEVEVTVNDTASPTGEISIGTNKWNSFLNTITFGQFFKKTEQVTITAQDNESGVASVSYYISDSGLTEEEVKKLENWTAGNTDKTTISISQKESCVVYAKITDNQGNMTYISSDGLQFDGTLPSITGVTDGGTYCTSQTVTVADDNLETVTVNGKEQILLDGKFTLDVKFDTAAIVIAAEDKAGNVTTVTVNAGHSYGTEWKSESNGHWQECAVCGDKSKVSAHTWDSGTVTVQPTTDKEGEKTYTCTVCGKTKTETLGKLPPSHTHNYGTDWKSDNSSHWHECSCGEKSETAAHRWDSGTVTVQPTTDREGEKTYTCTVCGKTKTETVKKFPSAGETGKEDVANNSVKLDSGISLQWKGKAIALKWAKVAGAEGYDVFAAQSGKKLNQKSPVKTVKNGKTSVSLTKIAGKKISGKKVYSVKIKAWKYADGKKIYTGSSRTYHIAGKENRKYTNAKKLKPAKKKYVLKKGRSFRIKVTIIKQSKKKKLPPKSYGPTLQYRSGNEKIATVTQGGKVKAKKKGTCYIYVTALNGVRTKIKITVK